MEFRDFLLIFLHDHISFRTWTYQRHITHKNVKQLGKLVQMQVTQNMSYRCDTGIMLGRKTCPVLLGIHTHASEFPDAELLSLIGKTILEIKYRTAVINLHRNGNDQHDG